MIKVMIVDDSALVRQVLTEILSMPSDIEVIATASDPVFAEKKIQQQKPDVIVLDLEMPRMDGITFLKKLMQDNPIPVVICASLSVQATRRTMDALAAGAIAVVAKPAQELKQALPGISQQLVQAIRAAVKSNPRFMLSAPDTVRTETHLPAATKQIAWELVLIGASTGGTQAIENILRQLPDDCPGIVVVQHMPAGFTAAFAERLNTLYHLEVQEAYSGARVQRGRILIAPGGKQLSVQRDAQGYFTEVRVAPPVNRHCPSVDVMFDSASAFKSDRIAAILLTGMGSDGAKGLLSLRQAKSITFAQDEQSCVVFGMPKEAVKLGAVCYQLPLGSVAQAIAGDLTGAVPLLSPV